MGQVFGGPSDLSTISYVIPIEGGWEEHERSEMIPVEGNGVSPGSGSPAKQPDISSRKEKNIKPGWWSNGAEICSRVRGLSQMVMGFNKTPHGNMKCRRGRQGTWEIADAVPSPKPDG